MLVVKVVLIELGDFVTVIYIAYTSATADNFKGENI